MFNKKLWKKKTKHANGAFFEKFSTNKTRKRSFVSTVIDRKCLRKWQSRKFRNEKFRTWSIERSIHDLSIILARHIQGVQKYRTKFFNTKLTILNNYFIFMWNKFFEKIENRRRLSRREKRSNFIFQLLWPPIDNSFVSK